MEQDFLGKKICNSKSNCKSTLVTAKVTASDPFLFLHGIAGMKNYFLFSFLSVDRFQSLIITHATNLLKKPNYHSNVCDSNMRNLNKYIHT